MARRPFSKPVRAQEERNGPPSADQGLSTAWAAVSGKLCVRVQFIGATSQYHVLQRCIRSMMLTRLQSK